MRTGSLRIGEVATRSGVSTRAIRVSEAAGVLPTPALESNGYRLYTRDAVEILGIIKQAQGLGLTLAEINAVGAIKRSGQAPCERVGALAREKLAELDRAMRTLAEQRLLLRNLLAAWRRRRGTSAAVCPHIEHGIRAEQRRKGRRQMGEDSWGGPGPGEG